MFTLLRERAPNTQRQPWARIWTEDRPYWNATANYLDAHVNLWQEALH